LTSWRDNADLTIKILGLGAALFGVLKYFSDAEDARLQATRQAAISYVEIYGSAELRDRRQRLFEFWLANADVRSYLQRKGVSAADYRSFLLEAFKYDRKPTELLSAIYAMGSFYDQLALCKSTEICDAKIVDTHFCGGAKEFLRVYGPIIDWLAQSSGTQDFGEGARYLGGSC
jgi:hypothetical protein